MSLNCYVFRAKFAVQWPSGQNRCASELNYFCIPNCTSSHVEDVVEGCFFQQKDSSANSHCSQNQIGSLDVHKHGVLKQVLLLPPAMPLFASMAAMQRMVEKTQTPEEKTKTVACESLGLTFSRVTIIV